MKDAIKPVKRASPKAANTFTAEERAAMQDRAAETKAARGKAGKVDGESEVLARIAAMKPADRKLAQRIHAIVKASAPALSAKTWYGMPAYANAEGKVVCFFQDAAKFKSRYATFGFSDQAGLDDGNLWPTAFALTALTPADEKRLGELVKKAAG